MSKKNKQSEIDLFGDSPTSSEPQESFEALFRQTSTSTARLKMGDAVRGEILSIGREEAFISTGRPQDGVILIQDLKDENGELKYKVGDLIDTVVAKIKDDEVRLIRKGSNAASQDLDSLEDAFDMELPVEGRVVEPCNGGYRVNVMGKIAFCPISQIDGRVSQDPDAYVGKKFEFLIIQFEPGGRKLVVSRRKLLDLQKVENEGKWIEEHKPGEITNGVISRLERFGAFVTLAPGVDGLVPISELGWSRVKEPSEVVKVGESVQVKILDIQEDGPRLRISLSIKQAGGLGDPWLQVPQKFPEGTVTEGTVEKKEVYGLFVNIAPGITGLLPKSKWRDLVDGQQFESKKRGDVIKVRVDQIQFEEHRISLGIPGEDQDDTWKEHVSSQGLGTLASAFQGFKPLASGSEPNASGREGSSKRRS